MSNPFFNAMGGGSLPGPMGNMMGMIQQFNEFQKPSRVTQRQRCRSF